MSSSLAIARNQMKKCGPQRTTARYMQTQSSNKRAWCSWLEARTHAEGCVCVCVCLDEEEDEPWLTTHSCFLSSPPPPDIRGGFLPAYLCITQYFFSLYMHTYSTYSSTQTRPNYYSTGEPQNPAPQAKQLADIFPPPSLLSLPPPREPCPTWRPICGPLAWCGARRGNG